MHTLGITVAQIAFKNLLPFRIKSHCAKRTGRNAQLTADASIKVDCYAGKITVPVDSFSWTGSHAGGIFTLLAAYRKKIPLVIPIDDSNAGSCWVAYTALFYGTRDLAQLAARALFRIGNKYSRGHLSASLWFYQRPQVTEFEFFKYFQL
jgi:hypothetical protein